MRSRSCRSGWRQFATIEEDPEIFSLILQGGAEFGRLLAYTRREETRRVII